MSPTEVLASVRASLSTMHPADRASLMVRMQQRAKTDQALARLMPRIGIMK